MDTLFHFTSNPRETWASCERRWQLHVETQTRSPVHMVSARGDAAEPVCPFYCHWLREKRLLPARTATGYRGELRSAHLSNPCYSRVRIQKLCESRGRVAHTHTKDSEIKEIDLLGLNLMNPTSRECQSISMLNAGLTISQLKLLYELSKI